MLPGPRPARGRLTALLGALLAAALLLSGCGGGSDSKDSPKAKSPTEVMQNAKKLFDDASSVHLVLATDSSPPAGSNGVLGATGDLTHDPAFEGDVKVVLSGLTATVPITSVDGKVYAKLPLSTGYATIKPGRLRRPRPGRLRRPGQRASPRC